MEQEELSELQEVILPPVTQMPYHLLLVIDPDMEVRDVSSPEGIAARKLSVLTRLHIRSVDFAARAMPPG